MVVTVHGFSPFVSTALFDEFSRRSRIRRQVANGVGSSDA